MEKRTVRSMLVDSGGKSEKRLAKRIGGNLRPASGALQGAKGDVDLPAYLLEAKSTVSLSMSLKYEWLRKISKEALNQVKKPALSVMFVSEDGHPKPDGKWVMIPEHVFKDLIE